jgi:hypothetical protein
MAKGLARAGFDIDLRDGGIREEAFAHVLFRASVEHKFDEKCRETGNVFLEFRQHGKPSGLATTTAEFWAIEVDRECWVVMATERLKAIARQAAREPGRRRKGGDGDAFDGVVVPLGTLVAACQDRKVRRG